MLLPGEKRAIETVLYIGGLYGYGNMIAHLKTAWAKSLIAQGISKDAALQATNVSAYPIDENEPSVQGGRADRSDCGHVFKYPDCPNCKGVAKKPAA